MTAVLLAHATATLAMAGLIWFVQGVHYPLIAEVGAEQTAAYAAAHARLTTWVVAPLMLVEAATALLLLADRPPGVPAWQPWLGAGLLAVIWCSTALLQVPQHRALGCGFDPAAHRRLVRSNWIRTAAWTLRGGLALWMIEAAWR